MGVLELFRHNRSRAGLTLTRGNFNLHTDQVHFISTNNAEDVINVEQCIRDAFPNQCVDKLTRLQAILGLVLCNKEG